VTIYDELFFPKENIFHFFPNTPNKDTHLTVIETKYTHLLDYIRMFTEKQIKFLDD